MSDNDTPPDDRNALIEQLGLLIEQARSNRQGEVDTIDRLNAELAALGHHPNYAAYVMGGMLFDRGFGVEHILPVWGFYALDWRVALDRLTAMPETGDDNRYDLLPVLRTACATDPTFEAAGERFADAHRLLKTGRIDPFWLKRPKLGLGQPALIFGIEPHHANGHRGLFASPLPYLRRAFQDAGCNQVDQRFGAMLVPVIEAGGETLDQVGAAALHHDAEARYRDDCERFAVHQRASPDRRWRWKPALSRQGHLVVSTANAKEIGLPAEPTRGHAAAWLEDHSANLRLPDDEQ